MCYVLLRLRFGWEKIAINNIIALLVIYKKKTYTITHTHTHSHGTRLAKRRKAKGGEQAIAIESRRCVFVFFVCFWVWGSMACECVVTFGGSAVLCGWLGVSARTWCGSASGCTAAELGALNVCSRQRARARVRTELEEGLCLVVATRERASVLSDARPANQRAHCHTDDERRHRCRARCWVVVWRMPTACADDHCCWAGWLAESVGPV